jgi:hypothetical protein
LLLSIAFSVLRMLASVLAPVLAPVLAVALTPGALRTGLVVAIIRIRLTLVALPPSPAFALAVGLATEALLGILRARPKTRPAGCTSPPLHGSPQDGLPVTPCAVRALNPLEGQYPIARPLDRRVDAFTAEEMAPAPQALLSVLIPILLCNNGSCPKCSLPPQAAEAPATVRPLTHFAPLDRHPHCLYNFSGSGGPLLASTTGLILTSASGLTYLC